MLRPVEIEQELLSLPDVARELGISHVQVWRLVHRNKLPVVQVGTRPGGKRVYGVRREALDAFAKVDRPLGRPPRRTTP